MNKQSAVKAMFSGSRGTYAQIKLSPEHEEAEKAMTEAVDAFLEKLTPEQQRLFHEAYDFIADENAAYAEDHFVEGFKFGLLIGIEAGESNTGQ